MHRLTFMRRLRLVSSAAVLTISAACAGTPTISPAESPGDASTPVALPIELSSHSVLATPPMRDTARVAGVTGAVAVLGLLNQTAPCYALSAAAARTGSRVSLVVTATE